MEQIIDKQNFVPSLSTSGTYDQNHHGLKEHRVNLVLGRISIGQGPGIEPEAGEFYYVPD